MYSIHLVENDKNIGVCHGLLLIYCSLFPGTFVLLSLNNLSEAEDGQEQGIIPERKV